jgi:hypothetical protein
MLSASPEWFKANKKDIGDFLWDAEEFIVKRHGRESVIGYYRHYDERDPHIHIFVVPKGITRDKHGHTYDTLTASPWVDGGKKLSQLQTDFARDVGKKYGLERGIEGSKARHQTVRRFYGALNKTRQTELIAPSVESMMRAIGDEPRTVKEYVAEAIKIARDHFQIQVDQMLGREATKPIREDAQRWIDQREEKGRGR